MDANVEREEREDVKISDLAKKANVDKPLSELVSERLRELYSLEKKDKK